MWGLTYGTSPQWTLEEVQFLTVTCGKQRIIQYVAIYNLTTRCHRFPHTGPLKPQQLNVLSCLCPSECNLCDHSKLTHFHREIQINQVNDDLTMNLQVSLPNGSIVSNFITRL